MPWGDPPVQNYMCPDLRVVDTEAIVRAFWKGVEAAQKAADDDNYVPKHMKR